MANNNQYLIDETEERELLSEAYKKLIDNGYSHEYIGAKLAVIIHAIELATQDTQTGKKEK
jgi:hypothetical protein